MSAHLQSGTYIHNNHNICLKISHTFSNYAEHCTSPWLSFTHAIQPHVMTYNPCYLSHFTTILTN